MNQTTTNDKYSLAERLKRVKKTRWIRFSIVALLYIGWTIWLNNYYVLCGLLLLIDIYLTQYIPWGWWKTSKNPVVRPEMEWVDAIVKALAMAKGFIMEPGSYVSVTTRLRILSNANVLRSLGSNPGQLTKAKFSPVIESATTTAPAFAWCFSTALRTAE